MAFEMITNRQIIFGEGKLSELPKLLKWYGKKKVMFVTYGMHHKGYQIVSGLLRDAGIDFYSYEVRGRQRRLHRGLSAARP